MQKDQQRKRLKSTIGVVISDKMDKTAVVRLQTLSMDPLYKKVMKHKRKVKAHNPQNKAKLGDRVVIIPTRPLSKEKRYCIIEVIKQAKVDKNDTA
jgi:small subunit ribosomal protein S17